jgi:hypothetical protein
MCRNLAVHRLDWSQAAFSEVPLNTLCNSAGAVS